MTPELQEPMEIGSQERTNGTPHGQNKKGFNLYPVSMNDSGEGLPYAPENWPNTGDKWGWKAGKKMTASRSRYVDRYVYLPSRLCQTGQPIRFKTRGALGQYVRSNFPNTDVDAFFASFSWTILPKSSKKDKVLKHRRHIEEQPTSNTHCKANNSDCNRLNVGENSVPEKLMLCNICCNEPGFCRDCCCIVCQKFVTDYGGFGQIRCQANVKGFICGHNCHIDCALRAYIAGTVEGSIALDAEYYCRLCDSKADLVPHVRELLDNCKSIDSREDTETVLKVGISLLRGSKKKNAVELFHVIELAMVKLQNGTDLADIWEKDKVSTPAVTSGCLSNTAIELPQHSQIEAPSTLSSEVHHQVGLLKFEDNIDGILKSLRKSQEREYRVAEEKLSYQKSCILNLYQQLDNKRNEMSMDESLDDQLSMLDSVQSTVVQIKREVSKLKEMEVVAKGFGRVPKHIIIEHFSELV